MEDNKKEASRSTPAASLPGTPVRAGLMFGSGSPGLDYAARDHTATSVLTRTVTCSSLSCKNIVALLGLFGYIL